MTGAHAGPVDRDRERVALAEACREWAGFMVWSAGVRFDDRDRFLLWSLLNDTADHLDVTA